MTKENKVELGRSLTEMLGTLAIMGVLSIGAITGFNYAMNKHRANELLDEARKRAYTVMTQIQLGLPQSLSEYNRHNIFAGGIFSSDIITTGLIGQFGLKVTGIKKAVCQNLLDATSNKVILRRLAEEPDLIAKLTACHDDESTYVLIYNNDLSSTVLAYELRTPDECENADKKWCTGIENGICRDKDCCAGRSIATCKTCDTGTGEITTSPNYMKCTNHTAFGTELGYCLSGNCTTNKTLCDTNQDCLHLGDNYFCYYPSSDSNPCTKEVALAMNGRTGICREIGTIDKSIALLDSDGETVLIPAEKYITSTFTMNWWSAQNWCAAQGKRMLTNTDLDCWNGSVRGNYGNQCCIYGNTNCTDDASRISLPIQAMIQSWGRTKRLRLNIHSGAWCWDWCINLTPGYGWSPSLSNSDYHALCQ